MTCTSFQPFYIIETHQLREIQPFIHSYEKPLTTEEPSAASVTRHTHCDM